MSSDDGGRIENTVDKALPDWISKIDNIDTYVRTQISKYFVGIFISIVAYFGGIVDSAFGAVLDAFDAVIESQNAAFTAVVNPLLSVFATLEQTVMVTAGTLGPLGPVFVAGVAALSVVIAIRLVIALADSIPGLQGVVTFLRGG